MNKFIEDILTKKMGNAFDTLESELEFSPYMVQRYLSGCSPTVCNILNQTTNGKFRFLDKKQLYKLWIYITPKNFNFINLPKRKPRHVLNELDEKVVDYLSKKHKISQREVAEYIKELNLDITNIQKLFK